MPARIRTVAASEKIRGAGGPSKMQISACVPPRALGSQHCDGKVPPAGSEAVIRLFPFLFKSADFWKKKKKDV